MHEGFYAILSSKPKQFGFSGLVSQLGSKVELGANAYEYASDKHIASSNTQRSDILCR